LWFADYAKVAEVGAGKIGRPTQAGALTLYGNSALRYPSGLTVGPDGAIWFAGGGDNSIDRISLPPYLKSRPDTGPPGQAVNFSGGGFPPGYAVTVSYQTGVTSQASVQLCHPTATSLGQFTCSGSVPPSTVAGAAGSHVIKAVGKSGTVAEGSFLLD
jgi:hypothetical protein